MLSAAVSMLRAGKKVVLASVIQTKGSVPGKVGAKLLVSKFGEEFVIDGTVGGAGLEMKVIQKSKQLYEENKKPAGLVETFGLNKGAKGYEVQPLNSLCGGQVTISYEVLIPMPHILLMGGGHCAKSISNLLPIIGWDHSVHDTRDEYSNPDVYPSATETHCNPVDKFFEAEDADTISRFSDILLLGHDWAEDEQRLISLVKLAENGADIRIGVIGSKSKWMAFKQSCIDVGVSEETLAKVRCPIGVNVGAETPDEIAIAVLAEIMAYHKDVDVKQPNWREKMDS